MQVQDQLEPLIRRQDLSFVADIPIDLPMLHVDPTRLLQILYNLVSNAIKFTPAQGHVRVHARRDADAIEIAVEDDGVGIRTEDVPRLFQEFEQLGHAAHKPATTGPMSLQGSGLGLVLTKRLVELHGGTIAVESEHGRGSVFRVRLPIEERDASAQRVEHGGGHTTATVAPSATATAPVRVVVVEDDPGSCTLVRAVLERMGHEVFEAANIGDARRLIDEVEPQLVVSDIQVPGGGGEALLAEIRNHPSRRVMPVIATTARAMDGDRERLLALGFDAYLSKPIDTRELAALVAAKLASATERSCNET
jgi:CheY-like chemotaxis protein